MECSWDGDSRVVRLLSKAAVRRLRWIYGMLNVAGVAVDVLSRGLGADWPFEFSLTILWSCLGRIGSKKYKGEGCWFGWKNDLLNCKYKVTFQPDGCAEPTCAAMYFIYFFSLGEATSLGEGKLWNQTCWTSLKNWPCVISCPSGGVGK